MSQRVDLSQYYTKRQADDRFFRPRQAPAAPAALAVYGHGVVTSTTDQSAYLDLTLTDPTKPDWVTQDMYVQAYVFVVTFVTTDSKTVTRSFLRPHSTTYRLSDLPCHQAMQITAAAVDCFGQQSDPCTAVSYTTDADTIPPAAPSIAAEVLTIGALITVTHLNTESDFNHYELWRGRGYNTTTHAWAVAPESVLSFTSTIAHDLAIPSLQTDWGYYVTAVDSSGNSSASAVVGPLTLSPTGQNAPPVPSLIDATAVDNTDGTITFRFFGLTEDQAPTLSQYHIWRKADGLWLRLDTIPAWPNGEQVVYLDQHAVIGRTYTYAASAVNNVGDESAYDPSSTVSATASDIVKPNPPTALQFVGRVGGLDLSWTPSTSPDVVAYKVRYSMTGSFSGEHLLVEGTQFTIYGLTSSREELANVLTVELLAWDGTNDSDPCPSTYPHPTTVTYPALAHYQPADNSVPWIPQSQLALPQSDGSATISWTAPSIPDRAGYQVDIQERTRNDANDWVYSDWELQTTLMDATAGTKSFTDVGLEPYQFSKVEYRYRVRTLDTSGNISPLNLLDNADFEDATSPAWPTVPLVAGLTGNAVRVCSQDDFSQQVEVTAGTAYTLSGYLKQDLTAGAAARLIIEWRRSNLTVISESTWSGLSTGTWARQVVSAVAPAGAVYAVCRFLGSSSATATTVLWDDVQFEANFEVSQFSTGVTPFMRSLDTVGPPNYATLNLTAVGGLGIISLRWMNPSADVVDYRNGVFEIWRSTTLNGSYTYFDAVPAYANGQPNSYDDTTPDETEAETYFYRLKVRDQWLNLNPDFLMTVQDPTTHAWSVPATATASSLTFNALLPAPRTLHITAVTAASDGSISVTWAASEDADIVGYRIWRTSGGVGPVVVGTVTASTGSPTTETFVDVDTVDDVTYHYQVTVFNRWGSESSLSTSSSAVTSRDQTPPAAPTNIRITGGLGSVRMDWDPVPTAASYGVYYTMNGTDFVEAGTSVGASYILFGREATREAMGSFGVRIRAYDGAHPPNASTTYGSATIGASGLASYYPGDGVPPSDPTDMLGVPANDGTILLTWTPPETNDLAGFVIEQQETLDTNETVTPNALFWEQVALLTSPLSAQYRAVGLEPFKVQGKRYTYRVRSVDNSGEVSDGVTTPWLHAVDIEGPGNYDTLALAATGALGTISLSWQCAPYSMPDYYHCDYEVWRADNSGFSTNVQLLGTVAGTNDGSPRRYDDFTPADNVATTKFYRLKVRDRWSNVSHGTTENPAGDYLKVSGTHATATATSLTTYQTLGDGLRPANPAWATSNPIVANIDGTITLHWLETSTGSRHDLKGYNIYRKPHFTIDSHGDETSTVTSPSTATLIGSVTAAFGSGAMSWTDPQPIVWRQWDYAITAFDDQLEESATDLGTLTFQTQTSKDNRPPTPPTNFTCTGILGGVILTWTPSTSPGVTGYAISIPNTTPAQKLVLPEGLTATVTGTSLTVFLQEGPALSTITETSFIPTIRAVRDAAPPYTKAVSDDTLLTTRHWGGYIPVDLKPPLPPSAVGFDMISSYGVTMKWTPSPSVDVARYMVEVLVDAGSPFWYSIASAVADSHGCFVAGLQPSTTVVTNRYFFRVSAIDNSNNSSSTLTGVTERLRGHWAQDTTYNTGDVVLVQAAAAGAYDGGLLPMSSPIAECFDGWVCKVDGTIDHSVSDPFSLGRPDRMVGPAWVRAGYGYTGAIEIPPPPPALPPVPDEHLEITDWSSAPMPVPRSDYAQITITWAASTTTGTFKKYQVRKGGSMGTIADIATDRFHPTTTFLNCAYDTDYDYEIRVVDGSNQPGPWSYTKRTVHTCSAPTPVTPTLPDGPAVVVTKTDSGDTTEGIHGTTFHVTFDPGYTNSASDHYNVYVSKDAGASWTTYALTNKPSVWDLPVVGSFDGPVGYVFKVKCLNSSGVSTSRIGPEATGTCPQATMGSGGGGGSEPGTEPGDPQSGGSDGGGTIAMDI